MYRVAVLNSHPIQYFAPLFRRLAREPDIDLTVYFCSSQGVEEYHDAGFGVRVKWDVPLLEGYTSTFLPNLRPGNSVAGFFSLINPSIIRELHRNRYDALWVHGHGYASYVLAIVAARILGVPVLMRCETHLLLQRSPLKRALRRWVMRLLYMRLCSACLPIGTRNREFYRFHGVDDQHLFLVPYVVDNDYFAGAAERLRHQCGDLKAQMGLPSDKPVILYPFCRARTLCQETRSPPGAGPQVAHLGHYWQEGTRYHIRPSYQRFTRVRTCSRKRVCIGARCVFEVSVNPRAQVNIGNHTWISRDCHIGSYRRIDIGANVLIGDFVSIRDTTHSYADPSVPIMGREDIVGTITIEDDAWIGRGTIVLGRPEGVFIGQGAVIGANSVVASSVPKFTVVAGAPARYIRDRKPVAP